MWKKCKKYLFEHYHLFVISVSFLFGILNWSLKSIVSVIKKGEISNFQDFVFDWLLGFFFAIILHWIFESKTADNNKGK